MSITQAQQQAAQQAAQQQAQQQALQQQSGRLSQNVVFWPFFQNRI